MKRRRIYLVYTWMKPQQRIAQISQQIWHDNHPSALGPPPPPELEALRPLAIVLFLDEEYDRKQADDLDAAARLA